MIKILSKNIYNLKMIILITLLGNICFCSLFPQEHINGIDLRYKGESKALKEHIQRNLTYPAEAAMNKSIGITIANICITYEGKIDNIDIINSVDKSIDNEIINILSKTKSNWEKSELDTVNQCFYIQIAHIMTTFGNDPVIDVPDLEKFNFLELLVVTSVGLGNNLPELNDSITLNCSRAINNGNYNDALNYINELIKRNPFNKDYYQLRISINRKLNNRERMINDVNKINNFIPGVSLDELLK